MSHTHLTRRPLRRAAHPAQAGTFAALGTALLLAACGGTPAVTLADKALMPDMVMAQNERTQEAYRFAAAHPEHLKTVPCYCGCNGLGHRNNLECYLKPESTPDNLIFDEHALACEICADITHLTMELLDAGAAPDTIRAAVDARFGDRGPGTDTPHPGEEHTAAPATGVAAALP
jgi:hypothetical protein